MADIEFVDTTPNYFVGIGVMSKLAKDPSATTLAKARFETLKLDPEHSPWLMQEITLPILADVAAVKATVAELLGSSSLYVPVTADLDVTPTERFPVTFIFGPKPEEQDCMLLGVTTQAFADAWLKSKRCYYELHILFQTPDKVQYARFFSMVICEGSRTFTEMDDPFLLPIDVHSGRMCTMANYFGTF